MPWRLLIRNVFGHKIRSLLTVSSVAVALALLCVLDATARGFTAAVDLAAQNRLVVWSSVSLFVPLPLSYEPKIKAVPGVAETTKFQWFGGYYQDPSNFFAQFGVDAEAFARMYPECEVREGSIEAWQGNRTGCIIGRGLAQQFGWKVGDSIPLISAPFTRSDGDPWTFKVEGIYSVTKKNFDEQTMFFNFDYLQETFEQENNAQAGQAGTFVVSIGEGYTAEAVQAGIEGLFENGPRKVRASPEAEFNRQFVSMMGNIPLLMRSIGGAVLFAIFFAVLNTMLMAGRERTRDLGIMKALGFSNSRITGLLVSESLLLVVLGAAAGLFLSKGLESAMRPIVSAWAPGFAIDGVVLGRGLALCLGLGLVSGLAPAWRAVKMLPVQALREVN